MSFVTPRYAPVPFSKAKPSSTAYDGQSLLLAEIQTTADEKMKRVAELNLAKSMADDLMSFVPIAVETIAQLKSIPDSEVAERFESATGSKPTNFNELQIARQYLIRGHFSRATARDVKNMSICKTLLWGWWVIETSEADMMTPGLEAAWKRIKVHLRERFGISEFNAKALKTRIESDMARDRIANEAIARLKRINFNQSMAAE